jgi:hypothetical protein
MPCCCTWNRSLGASSHFMAWACGMWHVAWAWRTAKGDGPCRSFARNGSTTFLSGDITWLTSEREGPAGGALLLLYYYSYYYCWCCCCCYDSTQMTDRMSMPHYTAHVRCSMPGRGDQSMHATEVEVFISINLYALVGR